MSGSRWHGPPSQSDVEGWQSRRAWRRGHRQPWDRNRRVRFMFFVMAVLFGGMAFLFVVAVAAALLIVQAFNTNWQSVGGLALTICLVPLAFFALAAVVGRWGFRRVAAPIADVMSAADAVAQGDLSVRLREDTPGEFGMLARRFNNMTAELERSAAQRRNLTADIAHELRNPLHILQGNLEGMLDGVYQPTPEILTSTLDETRLLARLVSDLQTLSLAESGELPLHPASILAADLLADVAASFSARAAEEGVNLRVEAPPEAQPLALYADPDRLDQVLSNLVANSLRYTPVGGSITLRAESLPHGARLTVSDTGVGIPPEDLPHIFDRFWRGDRSRTRAGGSGSGLGLAIAKQLVQAHGGTISAASRPGGGSDFVVELPDQSAK
jgi:signal transduction histidine kinase